MTHPLTRAAKHLTRALPFAALMTGTAALAQVTAAADDRGAETLKCLVQPDAPLAYPQQAIAHAGLIRIELTFTAADREPAVKALAQLAPRLLVDAALARGRSYRLPCMTPGQPPVKAVQTFRFSPQAEGQVMLNTPTAIRGDLPIDLIMECLRTPPKRFDPRAAGPIAAPIGNALLRMTFTGGETPPEVEVLHNSLPKGLFADYLSWARRWRLPCAPTTGEPVSFHHRYIFANGEKKLTFARPLTLREFVALLRDDATTRGADFDLDSMACPFTVRLQPWQPATANWVRELGRPHPDRTEFLRWLEAVRFEFDDATWERAAGVEIDVQVPCGTLNLSADTPRS